jgi:hypothetical protein
MQGKEGSAAWTVRPDALTPALSHREREKTNFERFLLSQTGGRKENRAFAPESCGEKAWRGMTASQ